MWAGGGGGSGGGADRGPGPGGGGADRAPGGGGTERGGPGPPHSHSSRHYHPIRHPISGRYRFSHEERPNNEHLRVDIIYNFISTLSSSVLFSFSKFGVFSRQSVMY